VLRLVLVWCLVPLLLELWWFEDLLSLELLVRRRLRLLLLIGDVEEFLLRVPVEVVLLMDILFTLSRLGFPELNRSSSESEEDLLMLSSLLSLSSLPPLIPNSSELSETGDLGIGKVDD